MEWLFVRAPRSLPWCFHMALKVSDSQSTELGSDDLDHDLTWVDDVKRALQVLSRVMDRRVYTQYTMGKNDGTYWDW